MSPLLINAQPRLQRLAHKTLPQEINHLPDDDQHKRDWIHPVDAQPKHLDANRHAPEAARQKTDVEKGGARQAEQNRCKTVKQREDERVARQIPAHFGIPRRRPKSSTIENASLRAIDKHAPPRQLTHDLVQRPLRHKPLLKHVAEAVKRGAEQGKEVALDGIAGAKVVGACDVVGAEDDA